jgi:hypothetical protein
MKAARVRWLALAGAVALAAGCAREAAPPPKACADPVSGCRLEARGRALEVRFSSPPGSLRPFFLVVKAPGASRVSARFAMRDMDMGDNSYRLAPTGNGEWRAEVVLPVCVAGTSDWLLTLDVDGEEGVLAFTAGK